MSALWGPIGALVQDKNGKDKKKDDKEKAKEDEEEDQVKATFNRYKKVHTYSELRFRENTVCSLNIVFFKKDTWFSLKIVIFPSSLQPISCM